MDAAGAAATPGGSESRHEVIGDIDPNAVKCGKPGDVMRDEVYRL